MQTEWIYLAQTDTTVGFLSQSAEALAKAKGRTPSQPFLMALSDFRDVPSVGRVPKPFRAAVRRAKKRTYVLPNGRAFRVVCGRHAELVRQAGWFYSTSANPHGGPYDEDFARSRCDVVVESKEGFLPGKPSAIEKLGKQKRRKLR